MKIDPNFNFLKVYTNVRIDKSTALLKEQYNKQMKKGSLVTLSPDDFETFFFATILNCSERGDQIELRFESASMSEITPNIDFVMIESQVFFEAYRHNLKVLQELGTDNFPLEKYIVNVDKDISPPSYLAKDAKYTISNGLPETDSNAKVSLVEVTNNQNWPPREHFRLEESQYDAFRAALTKQLVIIQGPPGTGKTYIGLRIVEVLLANSQQQPILIVCYTNHALDQFLSGILKFCKGKNELVRVGGSSQCEKLKECNLTLIKDEMKARREVPAYIHRDRQQIHKNINRNRKEIADLEKNIECISDTIIGDELITIIKGLNGNHYSQLIKLANESLNLNVVILNWLGYRLRTDVDSDDEPMEKTFNLNQIVPMNHVEVTDGFQQVQRNRKTFEQQISEEIKKSQMMSEEEAKAVADITTLLPENRWNLYRLWFKLYVQVFESKIKDKREEYRTECLRLDGLKNQFDIEIVKKAKIIGMTTTGAAKYRHIIDGTKPTITIVEEAAEVLEAHTVTALCQQTDHLILIGDHLQLRPNPSVYELAKKFNLEISLFERLIKNQMEYYQLKQQHRMRPCISSLLVPHIYKQLLDHPSVMEYEDVKGISKNMFFINHSQNEKFVQETRSHLNDYEAEFIVELCRYIVLQGYETTQVTILTTYSGQLHDIRKLLKNHHILGGVRVSTVDNFQGEECDIILLSFVRSNDRGDIGFLKDSHRINVALSRARKGLYCIGNFDCLAEKSDLWKKLLSDLTTQHAIGAALEIYCQNHTDQKSLVSSMKDFDTTPKGGCTSPCGLRLLCGHACESVCHIVDKEHVDQYKECHKKCDKIMPNCDPEHRCRKTCHYGDECGKCNIMVEKVRPECQHKVKVACSGDPSLVSCPIQCQKIRSCGHSCKNICSAVCESTPCEEKVQAESLCGHKVTVRCADSTSSSKLLDACTQPCGIELKCGHLCKGSCSQCKIGRLHISCNEKCTQTLICGHPCVDTCSIECKPCKKKCENSCVHSKCSLRCGEPCPPCMEKCTWRCEHHECTKLCSEPCDRELCEHPNTELLPKCEHPSIGVCGEKTLTLCRVCNKDAVEEIFFGDEDGPDARFIELEDCKHIIEVNGLIRWMTSEPESNSDSNGNSNNNKNSIQFKRCPKCKTIIRHTKSLNTFIQASLRDIQQVKLKINSSPEENEIEHQALFSKVNEILWSMSLASDEFRLRSIYQDLYDSQFDKTKKSNQALNELNNKFDLIERMRIITASFTQRYTHRSISSNNILKFKRRLQMAIEFIRQYKNSDQQRTDILNEVSFLESMNNVIVAAVNEKFYDEGKDLLSDAFSVANRYGPATDSIRKKFSKKAEEATKYCQSKVVLPLEQRPLILKAMGFDGGHWYKCPNGHVYVISECGGAMEESICPECGAGIGGGSHRLRDDNAVATEMGGATDPAWPPRQ